MSQENVDVVVTLMKDFNERKPWWELVDERIEWHSRPDEPDATTHHGREAVRDYIDGWDEMFPGYRIEPDEHRSISAMRFGSANGRSL